ncbi:MAG TPA: protease modulator HflC [Steroidobacteraceae bacterium]|nr:protease modulator HflC [Steroidobacteraceae bacterium]
MPPRPFAIVALIVVAFFLLTSSVFIVKETELAMKLRFGEIVRADYKPGLHFLIPFVNNVRKFDKRIITQNHPAETFLTSEGKILNVDFYVKWRINDVVAYYRSTGGVEDNAARRLGEIVKDSIKSVITRLTIQQIVAAERAAVTVDLLEDLGRGVEQLGIELVDVRVRRIDLPDDVTDSVYRRMEQSFKAQAAKLRAEGQATAETVRAEADRQRTEILAAAQRDAQRIRGEGDGQAADISARTYSRNPEFYRFYRSLEAYRASLGRERDILVIAPDGEFFRYLQRTDGR